MTIVLTPEGAKTFLENYVCLKCHSPFVITGLQDGTGYLHYVCSNHDCGCTGYTKRDDLTNIVTSEEASMLITHYVCSRCWSNLIDTPANDGTQNRRVACSNIDCNGMGFVTKRYAERRLLESSSEYMEAFVNLAKVLGIQQKSRSEKEIFADLGIGE